MCKSTDTFSFHNVKHLKKCMRVCRRRRIPRMAQRKEWAVVMQRAAVFLFCAEQQIVLGQRWISSRQGGRCRIFFIVDFFLIQYVKKTKKVNILCDVLHERFLLIRRDAGKRDLSASLSVGPMSKTTVILTWKRLKNYQMIANLTKKHKKIDIN